MSKKILFDLDNTLVGSYRNKEGKIVLEARPGVLELLDKLRDLKKQKDIKYILFTNVSQKWVEVEMDILEAHDFFDDVINRDTMLSVVPGSIEEKIFGTDGEFYGLKPFTVIEGDLLLINDNPFMEKAGEAIRSEYESQESTRKIDFCKVSFYEAIDPRRYEIIEELEKREEKTEFDEKRLQHMRENLDKIDIDNEAEMEKVYDSVLEFTFGVSHTQKQEKETEDTEFNDFELQVQKLIDLYF